MIETFVPSSILQARLLINHLEKLFNKFERTGVLDKIPGATLPEPWLKVREAFFADYADLKRTYRKFAQEANDDIGEYMFGGLIPRLSVGRPNTPAVKLGAPGSTRGAAVLGSWQRIPPAESASRICSQTPA